MCCIPVVFLCCIFSKNQNKLITGKRKLEEQPKSAQKNILILTPLLDALLLSKVIINNELTLTMKNTDVTQETTAQLRDDNK